MSGKEAADAEEHITGTKRERDELVPSPEELFGAALQEVFTRQTLTAWIALLNENRAKRDASGTKIPKLNVSGDKNANVESILSAGPIDVTLSTLANAATNNKMNKEELVLLAQELWTRYKVSHGYLKKNSMPVSFPTKNDPKDKLLEIISELQSMHGKLAPGVDVSQLPKRDESQLPKRAKPTPGTPVTPGGGASDAQTKEHKQPETPDSRPEPGPHPSHLSPFATPEDVVAQQGAFGVCGAYAFAFYVGRLLLYSQGFSINALHFAEKMKALFPCWKGARLDSMIRDWNNLKPDQACVENSNKNYRIQFQLKFKEYKDLKTAHKKLQRLHQINLGLLMSMEVGALRTGHAVVGVVPYYWCPREGVRYERIEALNSWGSDGPLQDINEDNFNTAFACQLTEVKVLNNQHRPVVLDLPKPFTEWLNAQKKKAKASAQVQSSASAPGPSSPTTYSAAVVGVVKQKIRVHNAEVHEVLSASAVVEQKLRIANAKLAKLTEEHIDKLQAELKNLQDTQEDAEQHHDKTQGKLDSMMSELSEGDKASLWQLHN